MPNEQEVTVELAKELGLLAEEFEHIKQLLGRTPNYTELSIYTVMWSEHASYKNSIKYLKTLPRDGEQLLVKAGEENAGMVDIGNGLACVFKIESHNHPSAVEPYQGAATGVGGINRDIFTMGARPIAQLNSLRFGQLDKNNRNKWLLRGVTKGIGNYGNAFGIPVVGGEIYFDDCYEQNPLVNAMSVGIMKKEDLIKAISKGVGNTVFIVGSATGKDGIHGSSFASADITADSADDIPSIQVGDPFQEKLLLEATLEVSKTGAVIGMQDMGAAGIICSTSEMSEKGNHGMEIHLDKVPLRQKNIEPWEILLSESQERMLIVVEKGKEHLVKAVFDKWDLNCAEIGHVTEDLNLKFYWKQELVAEVPAASLVLGGGAPVYDRPFTKPAYLAEIEKFDMSKVEVPSYEEAVTIAHFLAEHPNIASKRWVYQQYDSMVGTRNMSTNRPSDAAVVNIKGTDSALALTVDCNARYVYSNPQKGAEIAVAEAARNIVCTGGKPLAITNCLNFGNPYNPEIYWQFVEAIKGMGNACRVLNTPVTGGNVSFYNQYSNANKVEAVFPTPTIGMLGVLAKEDQMGLDFKKAGDRIYLIGKNVDDIACSEYLYSYRKVKYSPAPYFHLEEEHEMQELVQSLISEGLVDSVHDVSDGGLFICLLESGMPKNLGFDILSDGELRLDSFLFGEAQARVVISVGEDKEDDFLTFLDEVEIPYYCIGEVSEGDIYVDDHDFGQTKEYKIEYEQSIEKRMQ